MQYLIIDVSGLSATLEVTVILNKRHYQSINQWSLSSREIAVFNMSPAIPLTYLLSACLYVCLSVRPSVRLTVRLSVRLSVHLSLLSSRLCLLDVTWLSVVGVFSGTNVVIWWRWELSLMRLCLTSWWMERRLVRPRCSRYCRVVCVLPTETWLTSSSRSSVNPLTPAVAVRVQL